MCDRLGRELADEVRDAHDALALADMRAEREIPDGDAVCEPIDADAEVEGVVVLLA